MKLKKKLKRNLVLSLWSKLLATFLATVIPVNAMAESPLPDHPTFPLGSFTYIQDGLPEHSLHGPVWCYDDEANSLLVTAPARAKAKCELRMEFEVERQKIKYDLQISNLELRIETLTKQHKDVMIIKDKEIERLTAAALKRPNDYSVWWATGGFVVGIATTVLIGWATLSANGGY